MSILVVIVVITVIIVVDAVVDVRNPNWDIYLFAYRTSQN